jgi:hypothetical protein
MIPYSLTLVTQKIKTTKNEFEKLDVYIAYSQKNNNITNERKIEACSLLL